MVKVVQARRFGVAGATHGEGPIWDVSDQRLLWVDIHGQAIHRSTIDGSDDLRTYSDRVSAVARRRSGGQIVALSDQVILEDREGQTRTVLLSPARSDVHFNDGKCDPQGRFWIGTMADDGRSPIGALYRVDPDGAVTTVLEGVSISNGIAWAPDGRTMYYIDSLTQRIDAFDFKPSDGSITNRRSVVEIDPADGMPDGMTIDVDGRLWVAMWGGAAVRGYAADGRLETIVRLPTSQVTSCAFGGLDGRVLFVTTSTVGGSPVDSGAGGLFQWGADQSGPGGTRFAG